MFLHTLSVCVAQKFNFLKQFEVLGRFSFFRCFHFWPQKWIFWWFFMKKSKNVDNFKMTYMGEFLRCNNDIETKTHLFYSKNIFLKKVFVRAHSRARWVPFKLPDSENFSKVMKIGARAHFSKSGNLKGTQRAREYARTKCFFGNIFFE